jgi:pimeloyl-ACP methyl ester carboxylesterase
MAGGTYFIFPFVILGVMGMLSAILPYKAPPGLLSIKKVQDWIAPGRFLNFKGYSVFYRDSIGDSLGGASEADPSEIAKFPVVLFLHGFPTFSYDFAELYHHVSASGEYHAVNLDFLGFGVSDKPGDIDYSLHLQADIVESVLNSIATERRRFGQGGATPVHIIAHDMGDSVAQELMARWLDTKSCVDSSSSEAEPRWDLRSAVLLNGGLFPETHKPRGAQLLLLSKYTGPIASRVFTFSLFSQAFQEVFGPNSKLPDDEMILYWQSLQYKNGISSMHLLQQYMTDRVKHRERWVGALVNSSQLIPIRLINGPFDPVSGKHMVKRYQQLVPTGAQDIVMLQENVGHYPQLEDPKNVQMHIVSFLKRVCDVSYIHHIM